MQLAFQGSSALKVLSNARHMELQRASSLGTGAGRDGFTSLSERSTTFLLNNYNYLFVETIPLGIVPGSSPTLQWMALQFMNI